MPNKVKLVPVSSPGRKLYSNRIFVRNLGTYRKPGFRIRSIFDQIRHIGNDLTNRIRILLIKKTDPFKYVKFFHINQISWYIFMLIFYLKKIKKFTKRRWQNLGSRSALFCQLNPGSYLCVYSFKCKSGHSLFEK